jgi:hypothetical protein
VKQNGLQSMSTNRNFCFFLVLLAGRMSRLNWLYQNVAETLADAQPQQDAHPSDEGAAAEAGDDDEVEVCLGPTA